MDQELINRNLSVISVVADKETTLAFTSYILTVAEEDTEVVWEVRRRYSEFFHLRKTLIDILSTAHNCTGCCGTTRVAITFNFPRKRVLTSRFSKVIEQRTQALMAFICQLLDCTNGILFRNCEFVISAGVLLIIDSFLRPDERQPAAPRATIVQDAMSKFAELTPEEVDRIRGEDEEDLCQICLDDDDGSHVVRLSCKHTFHRTCLRDWLERNQDCPSCREPIIGKADALKS